MSQLRKLLIGKDLNYGSSKTSTTQNTATTPDQLADGAIGVYGIHMAGSTNLGKLVLITDGGSEAAGTVPAASFVGKEIYIAQGNSYGNLLNPPIELINGVLALVAPRASKYVAPVKGVTVVGYSNNNTAGLLNITQPYTSARGDLFSIGITNRKSKVSGDREPFAKERYSYESPFAGDTIYTALVGLITKIAAVDVIQRMIAVPVITAATFGTAFGNSATASVTNGSTAVTTSAAHLVTAGYYISILGDVYIAKAASGSSITLDRPYQGATNAAVANASLLSKGDATLPTALGFEVTDLNFFSDIDVTVQGILAGASLKKSTLPSTGSGSITMMQALEKETKVFKGTADFITQYIPKDLDYVDTTLTGYDIYWLTAHNRKMAGGDQGSVFRVENIHIVAFPQGVADSTNKGQSDFEDLMTTLFSQFPQISA